MVEAPAPAPVVTDHVLVRRQCPHCQLRVLPPVPGVAADRIGQGRFGPRLLALCPEDLPSACPYATLAKRIRRYQQELFVFVAELGVPPTNNAAERSLRGLIIPREVPGGTRSDAGSECRMILASIAATVSLRRLDPERVFLQLLADPSHAF